MIPKTTHARLSSRGKVRRHRQVVPTTRTVAHFDDFGRIQRDIVSLEIRSVAVLFFPSPFLVVEQVVQVETFQRCRVVVSHRQARRLDRRRVMHVLLDRAVFPNARKTISAAVVAVTVTVNVISAPTVSTRQY